MKKSILILIFLFSGFLSLNETNCASANPTYPLINISSTLDDGWYAATVRYSNYSTGTNATYTLNVKVEYDRVTIIDFGNGGSIHSGYNNEGYIYSGGTLYFSTDFRGNITAATATVTVSGKSGSMLTYNISIE